MRYINKLVFYFFIFYLSIFNAATARLATQDEISLRTDYLKKDISINADGTYESIVDYQITITKEQGREYLSQLYLYYYEDVEKLDILEAVTINNDQTYNVDKEMIEDKPLASTKGGFDQKRQIIIPFPNLEVNSKIRLRYKHKYIRPVLENNFSARILDSREDYITSLSIKLKSEIPLNIKVNDPNKLLKYHKDQESGFNNLEITNIKPLNHVYLEEPQHGLLNDSKITWVSVSSFKNWQELGAKFAETYENVINQPLPSLFQDIKKEANLVADDINKINTVTSLLNQKIQYMGDWRTVKGRVFPRSLDLIAGSQVGDCKDFSASTAAILKQLGYKVQTALVMRGEKQLSLANLPGFNNFNHAILKVKNKKGIIYWVDPTNFVSMAQGVFPDISGKKALVLDLKNSSYEQIPYISPKHSNLLFNIEIQPDLQNNVVLEKGHLFLKGEKAFPFTGAELYMSKNAIQNQIFYLLTNSYIEEDPNKYVILPDLTSRIVKHLEFKYQFQKHNRLINTNLGYGLQIKAPEALNLIVDTQLNQLSDLVLGVPSTYKKSIVIKKCKVKGIENLNYKIDTPWIYFARTCKNEGEIAQINDLFILKTSIISNLDLKSSLYQKLKKDLKNIILDATLIVG